MSSQDAIIVEGLLREVLASGLFRAELANGHRVTVFARARDRDWATQLEAGCQVRLEMSPFDMSRGRLLKPEPGGPE